MGETEQCFCKCWKKAGGKWCKKSTLGTEGFSWCCRLKVEKKKTWERYSVFKCE
jgi:hypothetical protein